MVSPNLPFARIGSHPGSDIVIPDSSVALRSHYLHATRDGIYCLFLDVAGSQPDEKGRWLAPHDEIVVGNYRVRASLVSAEQGELLPDYDPAAWGSALPPLPVMLVYCGELLKDKRRFRARLSLVGRRPQCRLQLKGKQVSSFHCILYWDREQLWCVDLRSSNGTVLNGQEIDCAQIQIGDRLEVGEFGLVYQRRSQGGGQSRAFSARPAAGETNPVSLPSLAEPAPPAPAVQRAIAEPLAARPDLSPATCSEEDLAESAEDRRLREALAAEVARLGSQQEVMQARWNAANEQLSRQMAALRDEAAQLAREREALAGVRSQFLDEQNAQTQDLAERRALTGQLGARAEQLAQLEAELASTAAQLKQQLAEAESRRNQNAACLCEEDAAPLAQQRELEGGQWLGQVAPAAIVAGLDPDAASQIASQTTSEVAWSYAPLDPADGLPPQPDAQAELQARWEAASQELAAQVEQLRAEASWLAADRQAFLASCDAWTSERDSAAEQLTREQRQLASQQAELMQAASNLTARLSHLEERGNLEECGSVEDRGEHRLDQTGGTGIAPHSVSPPRPLTSAAAVEPAVDPDHVNVQEFALDWQGPARAGRSGIDKSAAGVDAPALTRPATTPPPFVSTRRYDMKTRDAEQLTMLVSSRVGEKYAEQKRRLLWWSAGGIAALILLVTIVAGVMWVL